MILTEIRFVLLVVATWLAFFGVPRGFRPHVLVASGLVFYGIYAGRYLPLVVFLVLAVHVLSRPLSAWVAVVGVAGLLTYFKLEAAGFRVASMGSPVGAGAAALVPLGLSFLAFELMAFAIDRRRGRIRDATLVDLAAFAFFFPCRVAGPIKRFGDFTASVGRAEASFDNVYAGVVRILIGLVKKVAVADVLGVSMGELGYAETSAHVWKIALIYSLQIFFDFSAYSDIAIGISRLLGITVPENFRRPYLSPNIREFWNRWHISLSSWVRDYVFLPTGHALFRSGLRRAPLAVAAVSYLISFLLVGAWHGLMLNYLVWGAYHAALLVGYQAVVAGLPRAVTASRAYRSRAASVAGVALTFFLVTVGWVPFMTDLPRAWRLLRIMFAGA